MQGQPAVRHWSPKVIQCSSSCSYYQWFEWYRAKGGHPQSWCLGFRHVMNQFEVHFPSILAVRSTARMAVIDGTWTGSPCRGGKGTVLTPSTGNGNNPGPVDSVYPYLANRSFLSIIGYHDLVVLKFLRYTFLMKALKPKQKVAIDAPTRISSKSVRCPMLFVFSGSWLGSRYLFIHSQLSTS